MKKAHREYLRLTSMNIVENIHWIGWPTRRPSKNETIERINYTAVNDNGREYEFLCQGRFRLKIKDHQSFSLRTRGAFDWWSVDGIDKPTKEEWKSLDTMMLSASQINPWYGVGDRIFASFMLPDDGNIIKHVRIIPSNGTLY